MAKVGWRGQHINRLRLDLSEDHGPRRLLAERTCASPTMPRSPRPTRSSTRTPSGTGGATADIYATTNRGFFDGVLLGRRAPVNGANVNTFTWNGNDVNGDPMAERRPTGSTP